MPHARLPTARLTLTATQVNALTAVSYAVTLTILRLHPPESAAPIYLFGLCQLPPSLLVVYLRYSVQSHTLHTTAAPPPRPALASRLSAMARTIHSTVASASRHAPQAIPDAHRLGWLAVNALGFAALPPQTDIGRPGEPLLMSGALMLGEPSVT